MHPFKFLHFIGVNHHTEYTLSFVRASWRLGEIVDDNQHILIRIHKHQN